MKKYNPNEQHPEEIKVQILGSIGPSEPLASTGSLLSLVDDETAIAFTNIRKKILHVYFYQLDEIDDGVPFVIVGNGDEDPISGSESKVLMEFISTAIDVFCEDCEDDELFTLPWVASFNHHFNNRLLFSITH